MKNLVLFMHVSLDGFVAGTNGEMDWITVDDEIFDYVGQRVNQTNTAMYGRVTYQMMQAYWPTAADQPTASKHDIEHAGWYKNAAKIVVSRTLHGERLPNTTVVGADLQAEITGLMQADGQEVLVFGSPSAAHSLMHENLIDGYWLFVNPVLLGQGIPHFVAGAQKQMLRLVKSHTFSSGVVCLDYIKT